MSGRLSDAPAAAAALIEHGLPTAGVSHSGTELKTAHPPVLKTAHPPVMVPPRTGPALHRSIRPAISTAPPPDQQTPARRSKSIWRTRYAVQLAGLDAGIALVTLAASMAALGERWPQDLLGIASLWGFALAWPVAILANQGYDRSRVGSGHHELSAVLRAACLLVLLATMVDTFVVESMPLKVVVVTAMLISLAGFVVRFVARKLLQRRQARGVDVRRVMLVGPAMAVSELQRQLSFEAHHGMQVVGVCVPREQIELAELLELDVVGDAEDAAVEAAKLDCDTVAVAGGDHKGHLRQLAWSLEGSQIDLLVDPGLVEVAGPRMHLRQHIGLPLLYIEEPHFTGWRQMIKRAFDLFASAIGLIVISPLLLAIAIAIKLSDGGPVLFRQTRVGIDGSDFSMYKFRTMVVNAEALKPGLSEKNEGAGLLFKLQEDPRVTSIGRWLRSYSLDELPQLINVLVGQMSLVGPRPPLPAEAAEYDPEVRRRLLVKPGMTGLWQVSGRSLLTWEESVRLDLRYVENWSLTMDLLLLWKTVGAVVARRGAF